MISLGCETSILPHCNWEFVTFTTPVATRVISEELLGVHAKPVAESLDRWVS